MEWHDFFLVVDLGGVFFNAAIGATIARERRFDIVGLITLAIMTGLAGGMMRDVLLQAGPPVALTDPAYLVTALTGAVVAYLICMRSRGWRYGFVIADALALGCWASAGTIKALSTGLDWLPAVMVGVITAVGGGVLRDLCIGKTPTVLGGNTLYATAAVAASGAVAATPAELQPTWGLGTGIMIGAGLCLVARWRRWRLPQGPTFTRPADTDVSDHPASPHPTVTV